MTKQIVNSNNKKQMAKKNNFSSDFKKMLKSSFHYVQEKGVFSSMAFVLNSFREWLYFASHRNSSINLIRFNVIEKNLENKSHSTFYIPTPIIPFIKLIKNIHLPKHSVFVDYGAGKGRAMILAAECGFHKAKGLEFSPSLYKTAQKNIQMYIEKTNKDCFELINTDVLNYEVKKEDNFFYFFHPFNELILTKCLKNIYLSLQNNPRQVFLIYQINQQENIDDITASGFFKLLKVFVSWGTRFYIYEYNPENKF